MVDLIFILSVGGVCILWIIVAFKNNGGFQPKEIVQLFLFISGAYVLIKIPTPGIAELGIVLGTLILSVGMKVFKLMANGKDKE